MADINNPSIESALQSAQPTMEDALTSAQPPKNTLQTVGAFADHYYGAAKTTASNILSAFGVGYKDAWGAGPDTIDDSIKQEIQKNTSLTDYQKNIVNNWLNWSSIVREGVNSLIPITPETAIAGMHTIGALIGGTESAVAKVGEEVGQPQLGHTAAELIEYTTQRGDLELRPFGEVNPLHQPVPDNIVKAKAEGIIGDVKTPEQVATKNEAVASLKPEQQPAAASIHPDIETEVRKYAPDLFSQYDELQKEQAKLRESIFNPEDFRKTLPEAVEAQSIIDKINNYKTEASRTSTKAVTQLTEAQSTLDKVLNTVSPEELQLKEKYADNYQLIKNLQPDVKTAYNIVADSLAKEQSYKTNPFKIQDEHDDDIRQLETSAIVEGGKLQGGQLSNDIYKTNDIANDVSKKLQDAGRSKEEADTAGQLIQAHYESRSQRFQGKLGSANDLYNSEGPKITPSGPSLNNRIKGNFNSATKVLNLFNTADASTFIHESGHQWLEELKKDAGHSEAPESLKNDFQTVKDWLKVDETKGLTRGQHEKFARGIERYLMEGTAPSRQLASVFAKFKQWLTDIYKRVSNLRSPINDDIRGVFDRLLSNEPQRTIIAPGGTTQNVTTATEKPVEANLGTEQGTYTSKTAEPASEAPRDSGETSKVDRPNEVEEDNSEKVYNQPKFVDKSGNIKVGKITSNDDLLKCLQEIIEAKPELTDRGGNLTDEDMINYAASFGKKPDDISVKNLNKFFTGQKVPLASKIYAAGTYMKATTNNMIEALKKDDFEAYFNARQLQELSIQAFSQGSADIGRALRAIKVLYKENESTQTLSDWLKSNSGKTYNRLQDEFKRMQQLASQDGVTLEQVIKQANKEKTPGWGAYLQESFINNLISGPITHFQYAEGTKLYALYKAVPQAFLRGGISEFKSWFKDIPSEERAYMSEALEGMHSFMFGQAEGLRAAGNAIKVGASQSISLARLAELKADYEVSQGLYEKSSGKYQARIEELTSNPTNAMTELNEHPQNMFINREKAIPGVIGNILRSPAERMVAPIHSSDYVVGLMTNLNQMLWRRTIQEGLTPFTQEFTNRFAQLKYEPPLEDVAKAKQEALEQSLMSPQKGMAGQLGRLIRSEIDLGDKIGHVQPLVFLEPFVGMPSNIIKLAIRDATPFGPIFKTMRDDLSGSNGQIAKANAQSRWILGTAFWGSALGLYASGNLVGSSPRKANERAVSLKANGLPNSIRIGDMSYDISRLGVLGRSITMATDVFSAGELASQGDGSKAVANLIYSMGEQLTFDGPLSGLADALEAVKEPEGKGKKFADRLLANMVPFSIGLGQVDKLTDPQMRVTKDWFDSIRDEIPGLSETLQPKIDIFGQVIPNKEFYGVYASQTSNDPVVQYFIKSGFSPAPPRDEINGVKLTLGQYTEYQVKAGQYMKEYVSKEINTPGFDNWSVKAQHNQIKYWVQAARKQAQIELISDPTNQNLINDAIQNQSDLVKGQ